MPSTPSPVTTLSVVMATHGRAPMLPRALAPLLADPAAFEIVVVVDGSADGSIEYLRELARDEPRLRPVWKENAGAVAAQQTGIEAATGDVLLIMDDDVVAEPGLVSGHLRQQWGETDLVVQGYMPLDEPDPGGRGGFTSKAYNRAYERRCLDWLAEPERIVERLWGGNVSFPREPLLANGGIGGDVQLGYLYDWELGIRLAKAGLRGRFVPELRAVHLHRRSYESFRREARMQGHAMWKIQATHPDFVLDTDIRERFRPGSLRYWLSRATSRPRARHLAVGALDRGVAVAGGRGAHRLEDWLAGQLTEVERRHGGWLASRERPHPDPWLAPAPVGPPRTPLLTGERAAPRED